MGRVLGAARAVEVAAVARLGVDEAPGVGAALEAGVDGGDGVAGEAQIEVMPERIARGAALGAAADVDALEPGQAIAGAAEEEVVAVEDDEQVGLRVVRVALGVDRLVDRAAAFRITGVHVSASFIGDAVARIGGCSWAFGSRLREGRRALQWGGAWVGMDSVHSAKAASHLSPSPSRRAGVRDALVEVVTALWVLCL
jgi:hypothetical protein